MKRLTWWTVPLVAALMVGLATADLALAAKGEGGKSKRAAREGKGERSGVRGEYAILVAECGLTDEQKEQVQAKIQATKEAIAQWEQEHGEKAKELQKAMKEAKEAGNKEEMKRLGQELKTLMTERRRLQQTMTGVLEVLTPEQRTKWAGFRLYRQMMMRYKKVGLTEEQTAKVREMANAAAKELGDPSDEKAARKAAVTLREDVEQNVLTAEQREALEKKPRKERPEKGAAREKKGKKDTGAEG